MYHHPRLGTGMLIGTASETTLDPSGKTPYLTDNLTFRGVSLKFEVTALISNFVANCVTCRPKYFQSNGRIFWPFKEPQGAPAPSESLVELCGEYSSWMGFRLGLTSSWLEIGGGLESSEQSWVTVRLQFEPVRDDELQPLTVMCNPNVYIGPLEICWHTSRNKYRRWEWLKCGPSRCECLTRVLTCECLTWESPFWIESVSAGDYWTLLHAMYLQTPASPRV